MVKSNLGDRLIEFAVAVIEIAEKIKKSNAGIHFSNQLTRSGTAPALNNAGAESAESRRFHTHFKSSPERTSRDKS